MAIRITGVDRAIRAMHGKAFRDGTLIHEGLRVAARTLLNKSQELVPVDTEALKKSGRIEENGKKGMAAVVTVIYGGQTAPYAFIVHERLDVHHKPPTQARYLADAVNLVRGAMTSAVGRQVAVGSSS